ncbi:MAG: hypothetical protein JXO22_13040, partial [Phycisphaerae bacterium]|nr:hypothetical protein [Phycisphaerae bacterium]
LMRGWMAALEGGELAPEESVVYGAVLPYMMVRGTRIVADAGDRENTAELLKIVEFLTRPERRSHLVEYGVLAHALGRLGDERATPLLIELLADRGVHRAFPQGQGKLAVQTVGDAALIALLRIYDLKPATFGLICGSEPWLQCGFDTPAARELAHRTLLEWLKQNADKPADQRGAPQPVQSTEP